MSRISTTLKNFSSICVCLSLVLSSIFFSVSVFAFENKFSNSLDMEFILIPSGTFTMGSPPDEPFRGSSEVQHRVSISRPFYIQTTEVTLKQWRSLMGKRLLVRRKGSDNMPVTQVSWFDCM
jgi:sulfatase modifying factor 1